MKDNQHIIPTRNEIECKQTKSKSELHERITRLNAMACGNVKSQNYDIDIEMNKSEQGLIALEANNSLQQMLAAQMLSIHRLQQLSMAHANNTDHPDNRKYFTNAAIKLANSFTQQATLLAKLQGTGSQKIVVEHVEVHQGGQAVVGNIMGVTPSHMEKK